jgi:hypothetical protein
MAMNLRKIGMPVELQKIIMSTYKNAYINIKSKEGETENIHIGKGVKQGCPLSPTLFNLGIGGGDDGPQILFSKGAVSLITIQIDWTLHPATG